MGFKCLDDAAVRKIEEVKENREQGSDADANSLFDDLKEFDDEKLSPGILGKKKNLGGDENRGKVENIRMVGQPCYLITNSLDYNM